MLTSHASRCACFSLRISEVAAPIACVFLMLAGCQNPATVRQDGLDQPPGPPAALAPPPPMRAAPAAQAPAPLPTEPLVRVRLKRDIDTVNLLCDGPTQIDIRRPQASAGTRLPIMVTGSVTLGSSEGKAWLRLADGRAWAWEAPVAIELRPTSGTLRFSNRSYPGDMVAHVDSGGDLDLVSHVPLETYLAGVVATEMYKSWKPEAFKAQAVAARSYTLCELARSSRRRHDVEATVASQAYMGATDHAAALEAVRQTRGQALVYQGVVLPGFYSSSHGGVSQDMSAAFARNVDPPPLRGGPRGTWDQGSPQANWIVTRDAAELSARVAAWGKTKKHEVAGLGTLAKIEVAAANAGGRPTKYRLSDGQGKEATISAEDFRWACNHGAAGHADLPEKSKLPSGYLVAASVRGGVARLQGRGYGHGVGLSQWGAQGMALAGYPAEQILSQYYPGASLAKLYP